MNYNRHESTPVPRLHSIAQTREILGGISRSTVYVLIKDGLLKPVKLGKRTLVPESQIATLIERKLGERA